jgi:tetratricopeptide (TPR) repeat protein
VKIETIKHLRPNLKDSPLTTKSAWMLGALLVVAVLVAYQPVWHAGFIWDDDSYVTRNPTLRDLPGLWRIWFDVTSTPQYYPLVHTSFWLEYHAWGLNPLGFHLVNVFLHAIAAILLWRVLVRLQVPGAWIAAAIFALHPVEAESVAWITERKNVLSAVFYFAAALTYLRFTELQDAKTPGRRQWFSYLGSLALFLCALLSKTVACSLPATLLLVRWWKTGRVTRQHILPLLPFFVFGLALGLSTAWLERYHVHAEGAAWSLTFIERLLIAGRGLWFYAGKLVWPAKLTFIYPRWDIHAGVWWQWLFPIAAIAVLVVLWRARSRMGRGPLVAVLFFAGTLVPALGFFNVFPFRYSFVADHFQYLASVGLITLGAVGLNRLPRFVPGILLVLLAALTWRQLAIYRDLPTLWTDTVDKNPTSWMAQNNFGMVLLQRGKENEAVAHLQKALELDPNQFEVYNNLGYALLEMGRVNESFPHLHKALELDPNRATIHYNLGNALLQSGLVDEAIVQLEKATEIDPTYVPAYSNLGHALLIKGRVNESLAALQKALEIDPNYTGARFNIAHTLLQMGRGDEAVSHLQTVLTIDPDDAEAQKNMAWVLATSPEARIRDGAKAVELAERANQLTKGQNPIMVVTLAAAYAEVGRFPDATKTAEEALRLANDSGNVALAEGIRGHIQLYRSGRPFRDIR